MSKEDNREKESATAAAEEGGRDTGDVLVVNASGHVQELDRNFGLFSICALGIVAGNAWSALAGSISTTGPLSLQVHDGV
ncbi:MAG: hypothetical protein Q9157_007242 [Trypethelium eluteriae]